MGGVPVALSTSFSSWSRCFQHLRARDLGPAFFSSLAKPRRATGSSSLHGSLLASLRVICRAAVGRQLVVIAKCRYGHAHHQLRRRPGSIPRMIGRRFWARLPENISVVAAPRRCTFSTASRIRLASIIACEFSAATLFFGRPGKPAVAFQASSTFRRATVTSKAGHGSRRTLRPVLVAGSAGRHMVTLDASDLVASNSGSFSGAGSRALEMSSAVLVTTTAPRSSVLAQLANNFCVSFLVLPVLSSSCHRYYVLGSLPLTSAMSQLLL